MSNSVTLSARTPDNVDAEALVVLLAQSEKDGEVQVLGEIPEELADELTDAATALGLTGAPETATSIPAPALASAKVVILAGLGEVAAEPEAEAVRRAAGCAVRAAEGRASLAIVAPSQAPGVVAALAEGSLLGAYTFARYREAKTTPSITVVSPAGRAREIKTGVDRAAVLASAVNAARDLVNTAAADLTPAVFADLAKEAVKGLKVKVEVLDMKALRAGGYGGLVGVGQGSANEPRLVTLTYAPARAKANVALVGKGITFDSGGLSLKPAAAMGTMKCDMGGAAAVLESVVVAATLGLPIAVTGFLALAENMPSGTAQRPGDVITMRGGKTVEVLNTDAEGRLVMADALVDAVALAPDVIIDIATLTGAQVVALGPRVSGVMGSEKERDAVVAAAGDAGEQAWAMPLPADLREGLDSPIADLANIGGKFGGMLTAGLFLKEFTDDRAWVHIDIAGPAFNEAAPWGYTPKGGTGAGVRTLVKYLESLTG